MDIPLSQEIINFKKQRHVSGGGTGCHSLFEQIISLENLFAAWREFIRGKRKRSDVQEYGQRAEDNLFLLHEQLRNNTWQHGDYTRFNVCDPKPRIIHKALVADRIVHRAVVRVIEPIFDRSLIFDTWSCRQGKGTHQAILRCQSELNRLLQNGIGPLWILKCDVRKYFESVEHNILLELIGRKIVDSRVLHLCQQIIKSFTPGLPLGNLTSQLFANVYLDPFDHYIKEVICPQFYMRYCDDFILAHHDSRWLIVQLSKIEHYLKGKLQLRPHPHKIQLRPFHWGMDWLGYVLYPDRRLVRPRTRQRLWRNIRSCTRRYFIDELSREFLHSTFASYDGILKWSWNNEDRKRLECLRRCLP